jgi:hypothetical protein
VTDGAASSAAVPEPSLTHFFESHDNYRDSDSMRQELAQHALENYRFVYRKADGNDKKVRARVIKYTTTKVPSFRNFEGPLVIQTYAAHFNAIQGSKWIKGLNEESSPPKPPLAVATAAASRLPEFSGCLLLTPELG